MILVVFQFVGYLMYYIFIIVCDSNSISTTYLNSSYSYLHWIEFVSPKNTEVPQRSCRNLSHSCRWPKSIPPTWEKLRSLCHVLFESAKITQIFYAWMQCTCLRPLYLLTKNLGLLQSLPLKLNFALEVRTLSGFGV